MEAVKSIQRRTINTVSILLVIFTVIVGCVIIVSSIKIYHNACYVDKECNIKKLQSDSLRVEFYKNCNKFFANAYTKDKLKAETDSSKSQKLKEFALRIAKIESNQDTILSDIRQETNNIINKYNGWTAFWIALLAIFGGGIPIIIQYIQSRKTRLEVDELLDSINLKSANSHLQLIVSTLWIDRNCSVISDSEIKPKVYSMAVAEAANSLQELILRIEGHDYLITKSNHAHLINALVQSFRLIDVIKISQTGRKVRSLEQVQSSIRKIIKDLFDLQKHPESEIIRRIHDLIPNIYSLLNSDN